MIALSAIPTSTTPPDPQPTCPGHLPSARNSLLQRAHSTSNHQKHFVGGQQLRFWYGNLHTLAAKPQKPPSSSTSHQRRPEHINNYTSRPAPDQPNKHPDIPHPRYAHTKQNNPNTHKTTKPSIEQAPSTFPSQKRRFTSPALRAQRNLDKLLLPILPAHTDSVNRAMASWRLVVLQWTT